MFAIIGIILMIVTSVVIKIFDKEIRKYQWRKALVNVSMISGFLLIILGILQMFMS